MPRVYSSPHPVNDPDVDWNPASDVHMAGNPYPNVSRGIPPNYDAHQWGVDEPDVPQYPRSPYPHHRPPTQGWNASQYRPPRQRSPSPPGLEHAYGGPEPSMAYYHHPHRRHHHASSRLGPEHHVHYEDIDEEGVPFMPPSSRRGSWGSEESLGSYEDEEDDEWAEARRVEHENRFRRGGGRGGRKYSSPPPLMERPSSRERGHGHRMHPPDSPPPLAGFGTHPPHHAHGARVRVRHVASAEHLPRTYAHAHHDSSGSSFSSGSYPVAQPLQYGGALPAAALRRSSSGAAGLKKAMRWLARPITSSQTSVTLHPLLRTPSLLRTPTLHWDITRPPLPIRGGIPIGAGAGFGEPASSPPTTYMRLLIPIPGLPGAHWSVNVFPLESSGLPNPPLPIIEPGSPYARGAPFHGSPYGSPYGSPFPTMLPSVPIITTAAVLLALHNALLRRATEHEFLELGENRRSRVAATFWARCRRAGGEQEADAQVRYGVRRLDFLGPKTRWEGLTPAIELDEWIVRLGRP